MKSTPSAPQSPNPSKKALTGLTWLIGCSFVATLVFSLALAYGPEGAGIDVQAAEGMVTLPLEKFTAGQRAWALGIFLLPNLVWLAGLAAIWKLVRACRATEKPIVEQAGRLLRVLSYFFVAQALIIGVLPFAQSAFVGALGLLPGGPDFPIDSEALLGLLRWLTLAMLLRVVSRSLDAGYAMSEELDLTI